MDNITPANLDRLALSEKKIIEQGYVESYRDIYPEINTDGVSFSYCRSSMPLFAPLLLYEKVAFLVPPIKEEVFRAQTFLGFNDLNNLIHAGLIQPLISDPRHYDTPDLRFLLDLQAPSVLARGIRTLELLGLEDLLIVERSKLPLAQMASLPNLRGRMVGMGLSENEITERVQFDIMVNLADIYVFGHNDIADRLENIDDPSQCARLLYDLSEALTYPHLFGFGGTVNYSRDNLLTKEVSAGFALKHGSFPLEELPREDLSLFLRGINFSLDEINSDQIIEFHETGGAAALRRAIGSFEDQAIKKRRGIDYDSIDDAYNAVRAEIREASSKLLNPRERQRLAKADRRIQLALNIGGMALGSATTYAIALMAGASGLALPSALGGGIAGKYLIPSLVESVKRPILGAFFSPGLANLWMVRRQGK